MKTPSHPADLLHHPDVVRCIACILRASWTPAQDLSDEVADVQLRALRFLNNRLPLFWPQDLELWKGLAITSTRTHVIDRVRKAKRRRKAGHAGVVVENPDDFQAESRRRSERDPLDHQKVLVIVDEFLKGSRKAGIDVRILEGLLNDENQEDIGKELGLSHQQIRDRVRAIRSALAAKAAVALGAGALVIFLLLRGPGEPREARYYRHADDVGLKEATPQELAAELRERARPSCQKLELARCFDLLHAARQLDPEGDRAVAVQALYDYVLQGTYSDEADAKSPRHAPQSPKPQSPKAPEKR